MTDAAVRLSSLALRDFRNFERLDLALPANGLAVIGDNGQGKTNLLEAIYYLELLRSARAARDMDLVRFGALGFHIEGITHAGGSISIGFERATKRKRVKIDGAPVDRFSDAVGALPAVLFSPADIELIAGAPVARRRYLDVLLALSSRPYLAALQRYRGALVRRNAALRTMARSGRADAGVRVWDAPLAEAGGILWSARAAWVTRMTDRFSSLCAAIGEGARVTLRYASSLEPSDDPAHAIMDALESKRAMDVRHGLTHAGPHRDDLSLALGGHDLRTFGSAGQHRSAAIALRMIEWETLRDARGGPPMLLLDDPFAELDARRCALIVALLSNTELGQTMLTVPREHDIPDGFTQLERCHVASGTLRAWSHA